MSNAKSICTVCNYIYEDGAGELAEGIFPALKFDDLPDEWRCPECNSPKDMFQPCSCVSIRQHEDTCLANGNGSEKAVNPQSAIACLSSVSVGQLIAEQPGRASVFEEYGIDYCCGGKKTLQEVCKNKGIAVEKVVEKLLDADKRRILSTEPDWTKVTLRELVDHVVTSYHQPLKEELPRITQLAEKVAKVHGDSHPEMVEVLQVFRPFREQLELHMHKEEMILFPGIVGIERADGKGSFGCGGGIEHPIAVMMEEHDDAGAAISTMRKLTNDYTPPDDACNTFRVLLHSLHKLELDMHQHVHKENNILFPRTLALSKSSASCR